MARPGFVLEVDERTPPLVVHSGDAVRRQLLPLGSRVIYPPDPLPALADPRARISAALDQPLGADPLAARLSAGLRLTVVLDDPATPSPAMPEPDVRGLIVEEVLTRAAAAGVDDVEIVVAGGLRRRTTGPDLRRLVGERVYRSFAALGRVRSHDAEDEDGLVALTDSTQLGGVWLDRRVVESDLVVVVRIAGQTLPGVESFPGSLGHWLAAGLGSTATITGLGGPDGEAIARAAGQAVPAFSVEAVLDNRTFGAPVEFLGKREWEWTLPDQARAAVLGRALGLLPGKLRRDAVAGLTGGYGVVDVNAGDPVAVAEASAATVHAQQLVELDGQVDVALVGVGESGPGSLGTVTNPILAAWSALVGSLGSVTGKPVVRDGGAVIIFNPARREFSGLRHPSYVDFFDTVLPITERRTGGVEFNRFAGDDWYRQLYRAGHSCHGVHPLTVWSQIQTALARLSDVVWVGGDRAVVSRLGHRAATTLADALEMTAATVGPSPSIGYLHSPPRMLVEVR